MTQVIALLVDAYRELNARKLFWLTLAISGMVVLGFGSVGFTDTGVSILFGVWEVESMINANSPLARPLYMGIFSYFIVSIWMTWAATILALVSTTSIFPDFIAGGAIDIVLAKPISRLRLFIIKYLASLLFVILQVAIFSGGIFLCVGWRLDEWNFKIFLAVPIIALFFSYLFAVNVFVGVWTRSGLTALLMTMLFWFGLFSITSTVEILRTIQVEQELTAARALKSIERKTEQLKALVDDESVGISSRRSKLESEIAAHETTRQERLELAGKLDVWYRPISYCLFVLPKPSETVGILSRSLKDPSGLNIMDILEGAGQNNGGRDPDRINADKAVRDEVDQHSLWYVIGTSLGFELFVLAGAAWIFCRRDF